MWQATYSKIFENIKKEAIWQQWTDVNNWHKWHEDLDYCKIDGPFQAGNHFILKPKGMKQVKIFITEVDEGRKFTDCTTFLGAKMYDTHILEEVPGGLKLTNTLIVTGPLKWLWIKLVAQNIANTVPNQIETFIKVVKHS